MKSIKIFQILVIILFAIHLLFVFAYSCISGNGLMNAFPSVLLVFVIIMFFGNNNHAKIVLTILYSLLSIPLILIFLLQNGSSLYLFSIPLLETFGARISLYYGKFLFYMFIAITLLVNVTLPFFTSKVIASFTSNTIFRIGKASLYCIVIFAIASSLDLASLFFNDYFDDYFFSLKLINNYIINLTSTLFNILFFVWLGLIIYRVNKKINLFKREEKINNLLINTALYGSLLLIVMSSYLPKEFQILFEISIYIAYYLIFNALFKKMDLLLIDEIPNYQDYTNRTFLKRWLIAVILILLSNVAIYSFNLNLISTIILSVTNIYSMFYFVHQTRSIVFRIREKSIKILGSKTIKNKI